jgi:hypothetical protein
VIGIDSSSDALDAFVERAGRVGTEATPIIGAWPLMESDAPIADVVVCHHVVFNVRDLAAFTIALDRHARRRVVLELTAEHPMSWMRPYWKALHGIELPDRPTADDVIDVLNALGFEVGQERWRRRYQMIGETGSEQVARIARRLCLPASRHDELGRILALTPPPEARDVVTLWWSPTGQPDR